MQMFGDDDGEDELYSAGLTELQRKSSLVRLRENGVAVEIELSEHTPFKRYVDSRRAAAIDALDRLATKVAPEDAVEVLRQQMTIRAYLDVREWARAEIEASVDAHDTLERENRGQGPDSD